MTKAGPIERQVHLRTGGERNGKRGADSIRRAGNSGNRSLRAICGDADGAGDWCPFARAVEREEGGRSRLDERGMRAPRLACAKDIDDDEVRRDIVGDLEIDLRRAHVEEGCEKVLPAESTSSTEVLPRVVGSDEVALAVTVDAMIIPRQQTEIDNLAHLKEAVDKRGVRSSSRPSARCSW